MFFFAGFVRGGGVRGRRGGGRGRGFDGGAAGEGGERSERDAGAISEGEIGVGNREAGGLGGVGGGDQMQAEFVARLGGERDAAFPRALERVFLREVTVTAVFGLGEGFGEERGGGGGVAESAEGDGGGGALARGCRCAACS